MDSIRKTFKWCIKDVNSWASLSKHTIDSPQYTMGDLQCSFYLHLNYYEKQSLVVLLCRHSDDKGPTLVETRFVLELMTVGGYVVSTSDFRFSFARGGSEGMAIDMTEEDFVEILRNEQDSDALIVTCTSVLLEPSMVFLHEDVRNLSDDLWRLRNEARFNNAHFVARGERIAVCREILCSRSPVIARMFENGDDLVEERFQADVVRTMIDYCYCSRVSLRELDSPSLRQLSICANHYGISDLAKLLTLKSDNVTSSLNSWTESHTLQFTTFTNLCNRNTGSVEYKQIKMVFDENIAMTARLLFTDYTRYGKIVLEVTLENLTDVKSVFVRLFTLDNFSTPKSVEEVRLEVHERKLQFSLEYENSVLFSSRASILPTDILTLRLELKFHFPGEFHISDPEPWDVTDALVNHEPSLALTRSMRSLLESEMYSDASLLLLPTRSRVSVHRCILSVRSPVFEDAFRTRRRKISVKLDEPTAKDFLHYLYTGVLLSAACPETLDALHKVAGDYRMDPLKRACEAAAAKITLNTQNVISVYLIAIRADRPDLRNSSEDFTLRNKDLIVCGNKWKELRENNEAGWNELRQYISVG